MAERQPQQYATIDWKEFPLRALTDDEVKDNLRATKKDNEGWSVLMIRVKRDTEPELYFAPTIALGLNELCWILQNPRTTVRDHAPDMKERIMKLMRRFCHPDCPEPCTGRPQCAYKPPSGYATQVKRLTCIWTVNDDM